MAEDGSLTGVISGKSESDVAVERVEEETKVAGSTEDVLARIEGVGNTEPARRRRHELHQPLGSLVRERTRIAGRFGLNDGADEVRVDLVEVRRLEDMTIVEVKRGRHGNSLRECWR